MIYVSPLAGHFAEGATATLARLGEPDITGQPVGVSADGTRIATTFDLTGRALGPCDVTVTNPDSTTFTLPGGFTIEQSRGAEVWVDIVGRTAIRPNRAQTFTVMFGNRGDVDALGVPLWIGGIPKSATWNLGFDIAPPPSDIDWSEVPTYLETEDDIRLPIFIPLIPPGFTGTLKIELTVPAGEERFDLRAWVNPCYFHSPMDPHTAQCMLAILQFSFDVADVFVPLSCLEGGFEAWALQYYTSVLQVGADIWAEDYTLRGAMIGAGLTNADAAMFLLECAADIIPGFVIPPPLQVWNWVSVAIDGCEMLEQCSDWGCRRLGERVLDVLLAIAIDPNDIVGSSGTGPLQYLSGEEPLRYSILFENLETATAPAQEVVITDQLNPAVMDLSTFGFGPISFGEREVVPPPGLNRFTTVVDLRPDMNLLVEIDARLHVPAGLVTWHFRSIDPATGEPPEDPMVGFLPPNVIPPEGEGSVMFTVLPRTGLPTGTEIRNQASIVFDTNPSVPTGEWFNTLDNSKPTSAVLPLAPTQNALSFQVQWSGIDVGAGVSYYTVFVSVDGGPYTAWLLTTEDTSATFTGQSGRTYAFFSLARDTAGNSEPLKTSGDTSTTIQVIPVGGIAELPSLDPDAALDQTGSSGPGACTPSALVAIATAGILAVAGGAWYVRRRWLRHRP
jgi:hypothetical protein